MNVCVYVSCVWFLCLCVFCFSFLVLLNHTKVELPSIEVKQPKVGNYTLQFSATGLVSANSSVTIINGWFDVFDVFVSFVCLCVLYVLLIVCVYVCVCVFRRVLDQLNCVMQVHFLPLVSHHHLR